MELITIFHTFNPAEAEVIASRLEAAGLDVHTAQEMSALTGFPATPGVLVQVPEQQATEARELVTLTQAATE